MPSGKKRKSYGLHLPFYHSKQSIEAKIHRGVLEASE